MHKNNFYLAALLTFCFLSCRGPEGPAGPAGPGGESLSDPSIKPRIIYTNPPANSQGPYDFFGSQIQLRFNKIMDLRSLKSAVKLTSPTTSARIDTSSVYSMGGDVFFMYVADSVSPGYNSYRWKLGEQYTLSVGSSARDINGNSLEPAYSMTFIPEPHFRVVGMNPENGRTDVSAVQYISVTFNSPIDSSALLEMNLSPAVAGRWTRYNYDPAVAIFSDGPNNVFLNNNTTYTVTVTASAHDVYGNVLPGQFTSFFSTSSFRVRYASPSDRSTYVPLYASINAEFTAALKAGTIASAVTITPAVEGTFYAPQGSPYFSFSPTGGFAPETTYTVTIDTTLRSIKNINLSAPYSFSFSTEPFQTVSTIPADGSTGVSRNLSSVYLRFNTRIDTGSIRSSISMKDSSGAEVAVYFSLYDETFEVNFYPLGLPLAAKAMYTVTILPSLRSKSGAYLKMPYTFSFTTAN